MIRLGCREVKVPFLEILCLFILDIAGQNSGLHIFLTVINSELFQNI